MFKFMKSKKGFTLVELMIVVVIMAILVAVAVPIYSAVTKNARKKTCISNQREIISSVGNWIMTNGVDVTGASFTITNTNNNNATIAVSGTDNASLPLSTFKAMFKTVPCCPTDGAVINVTVDSDPGGENAQVNTWCNTSSTAYNAEKANGEGHIVPVNA